jgi:hypothetical protein
MSRPYLCVSIDTECDQGPAWRTQRPLSFEGVHTGILQRLQPLFAFFGAKPTYLVSTEVLRDARCAEELRAISASCELGAHLHEETSLESSESRGETGGERRDLTDLTDQFIRAFEFQPVSFRGGRSGIGRRTIGHLEDLGYSVESSVTPNVIPTAKAELSFARAPTQPYRADRDDPAQQGDSSILEIPITIRRRPWSSVPGVGRLLAPRWLRPTWTTEDTLVHIVEDEIADARRAAPGRPVILNAILHANEVVPAASRHASFEADARRILDRLRALLAFAQRESISVIGLGDVPEVLQT